MTDHPMPEYTADEKQALLADLLAEKALLEKWRDDWNKRDALNYRAICITLASLTAGAVGVVRENPDDIGLIADFDVMPPAGTQLFTLPPVPTRSAPRRAISATRKKELAKHIVEYLMDTGSAEPDVVHHSQEWVQQQLNTLIGQGK